MEREAKADQLESREMVSRLRSAGIPAAFINAPQKYNQNVRKPEDHTVQNILEKKDELRGDPGRRYKNVCGTAQSSKRSPDENLRSPAKIAKVDFIWLAKDITKKREKFSTVCSSNSGLAGTNTSAVKGLVCRYEQMKGTVDQ